MADEVISEYLQRRPAPALAGIVAFYSGYRQRGYAPALHRGLPSPYLTMIVTFDEPLTMARHVDPSKPPGNYDTLIGGLHTTPVLIAHQGNQAGIQLALYPLGARALLGLPAGEISGIDLDAGVVLGGIAVELHERVQLARTWNERFGIVDEILLRLLHEEAVVAPELGRAWRQIVSGSGTTSVADIADEVGWSGRHLGNRFRTEVGLTPKETARVVRFDRARRVLQGSVASGRPAVLAALAADHGYYDQAHLARDFRDFAGCAPSRWVAEEFGNVQAPPAVMGQDSMP